MKHLFLLYTSVTNVTHYRFEMNDLCTQNEIQWK